MFESKILHCCQVWGSCLSFLSWLCFPTDTRKLKTNFFLLVFFFCYWTYEKENINLQHSKGEEDELETVAWVALADDETNFLLGFMFCFFLLDICHYVWNCKCYEALVKMCSLLLMLSFACSKLSALLFNAYQAKYNYFAPLLIFFSKMSLIPILILC